MEIELSRWEKLRRRIFHVEIVIFISVFCCLLVSPLKTEYLYQRVAQQYNASNQVITDCDETNQTHLDVVVSQQSSRWSLLLDVAMYFPASLTGAIATSLGDKYGRKKIMILPIAGQILGSLAFSAVIKYDLPLGYLYVTSVVNGVSGYLMTLLMQAAAYITDITPPETRSMRMLVLEMILGVGGGVGGMLSGVWTKASHGFLQPMFYTGVLSMFSLLLLPLLPDSRKIVHELARKRRLEKGDMVIHNDEEYEDPKIHGGKVSTLQRIKMIYTNEISRCDICYGDIDNEHYPIEKCVHGGGRHVGRVFRIWSYLIIYNGVMAESIALMSVQTLYVMSKPLCFSKTLVGLQQGTKFIATGLSPLLVLFYQRALGFSNDMVIFISLLLLVAALILLAFSTQVWMVFVAMILNGVAMPAKPFSQSQLSKLVSETEHGAAFSLLSFTELMTFLLTTVASLLIYKATIPIMHGLNYLITTSVLVAPLILSGAVLIRNRRRKDAELEPLIS